MEQWPEQGVPANPRAWLVSAGRFKAIDALRRDRRTGAEVPEELAAPAEPSWLRDEEIEDDRLRMIFTCCHPLLAPEARVALTLREVCGLSTEAIAAAYLTSVPTMAQRLVRAKARLREANVPFDVPSPEERNQRLDAVLQVVYLVFNAGYSEPVTAQAVLGQSLEAIHLGRLLMTLLPEPEVLGLLALMLLLQARAAARVTAEGDVVLLEDQDRSLWDAEGIREGTGLVRAALGLAAPGPYTLQAAIAAAHAWAPSTEATDWAAIVDLYTRLAELAPSPVVDLSRAVAVAMRDGPEAGLRLVEQILASGKLDRYSLAHAARGELLKRAGRAAEAKQAYETALALADQESDRRLLQKKLDSLS